MHKFNLGIKHLTLLGGGTAFKNKVKFKPLTPIHSRVDQISSADAAAICKQ